MGGGEPQSSQLPSGLQGVPDPWGLPWGQWPAWERAGKPEQPGGLEEGAGSPVCPPTPPPGPGRGRGGLGAQWGVQWGSWCLCPGTGRGQGGQEPSSCGCQLCLRKLGPGQRPGLGCRAVGVKVRLSSPETRYLGRQSCLPQRRPSEPGEARWSSLGSAQVGAGALRQVALCQGGPGWPHGLCAALETTLAPPLPPGARGSVAG